MTTKIANIKEHIMLLACIFLAGTYVFGKYSVANFATFDLIFLRFFIASIFMFFILKMKSMSLRISKDCL